MYSYFILLVKYFTSIILYHIESTKVLLPIKLFTGKKLKRIKKFCKIPYFSGKKVKG